MIKGPLRRAFLRLRIPLSRLIAAPHMMLRMLDKPLIETSLGDLLPIGVKTILEKNGVHTAEAVRMAYPDQLLRMRGMGMLRFSNILPGGVVHASADPLPASTHQRLFSQWSLIPSSCANPGAWRNHNRGSTARDGAGGSPLHRRLGADEASGD